MPVTAPERSPWLRRLPPIVAAEVRRRRGLILAGARGRVLDLDDPHFAGLIDDPHFGGLIDGLIDGRDGDDEDRDATAQPGFDTIVCTGRLLAAPDLRRSVTALSQCLADDGELHLVEPVGRAGTASLLTASVGSCLPGLAGLHLSRDVLGTVRAVGLTVIDLERFVVPTAAWPLRHFVQARAVRLPVGAAGGPVPIEGSP